MSVPRLVLHDLGDLAELSLDDLHLDGSSGAAGRTGAGPFRLGFHAPGIVRLRIGDGHLPDYGLVADALPSAVMAEPGPPPSLHAGDCTVTIDAASFAVTLARRGETLLGPPQDGHFRRRFRLPRFAVTGRGIMLAIDLAEGEPVYGHGEKWGRLDHRGERLVSWNEDALGTNAEASYKNLPFAWSPRGWGLFVHTPGRVTHGVGYAPWSHRSYVIFVEDDHLDLFLIAAADGEGVLERFTWLTGRPAPVPRWSLGAWLSKAYYRDQDELLDAARRVRGLGLPMDVITLDGRAWQDTATRFAFGWDKARYPDPAATVRAVHEAGLRLCCWEYPLVSVQSPAFAGLAASGFFLKDAASGEPWLLRWDQAPFGGLLTPLPTSALIDFTNPEASAWWAEQHAALFAAGVEVMKTDFGEQVPDDPACEAWNGERGPRLHNVYPLLYNRCVAAATQAARGHGLVFARSGWTGSQTLPTQWGGDPQSDWGGLAGSIRGMLSWAASGSPWYATDIGGFYGEAPTPELFVRWCQAAVFASHMHFHGMGEREPWSFGEEVLGHVRAALHLRYQLIPYIEAALQAACARGLPLTRPMALAYPQAREAHAFDTQYLFGPDLLVAPILAPGGRVTVWLPEGAWWDWHTGERHQGPRRLELALPLERFPLFAREGAMIPLAARVRRTDEWSEGAIPLAATRHFG